MEKVRCARRIVNEMEEWDFFLPWYRPDRFLVLDQCLTPNESVFSAARELGRAMRRCKPGARAGRQEDRDAVSEEVFCDQFAQAYLMPRSALTALARELANYDPLSLAHELVARTGVPLEYVLPRLRWVDPPALREYSNFIGIFEWNYSSGFQFAWRLKPGLHLAPAWVKSFEYPYRQYGHELERFGFFPPSEGGDSFRDSVHRETANMSSLHPFTKRQSPLSRKDGALLCWSNLHEEPMRTSDLLFRRMLITCWLHTT